MNVQAQLQRPSFDGTGVDGLAAAGRAVRLREYAADPVNRLERLECWNGELRRAGETQP